MTKLPHIKRFLSLLMIAVMAFAITPRRTVHEIFGCHEKVSGTHHVTQGNETSIDKDGFHCACESQEFQTSFIEGITPQINILHGWITLTKATLVTSMLHKADIQSAYLRGPPSLA